MERANESLLKANERISELVHIKEQLSKEKDKVIEDAKEMSKQKLELDLIDFSLSEKNSLILEEQVVMVMHVMMVMMRMISLLCEKHHQA